MPLAKIRTIVLDCPEPLALAEFSAGVLGGEVKGGADADWVDLFVDGTVRLSFQRANGFVPPGWPRAEHSQQLHLDLDVDDLEAREAEVLALGARALDLEDEGGERDFRVYADPVGHPFCLIRP
ncbi:VOC family protein [Streptomyces pinistramenti]|uniref:VOC family protein n=1 Tax=Streptomyces pinistramenti TaxID=2884812 RepID=UPI001D07273D|nr:VOC family protein [Streptomyces pinistramenti]MCB5906257.1 VOC family protein [Streptomyces pinistramenti]